MLTPVDGARLGSKERGKANLCRVTQDLGRRGADTPTTGMQMRECVRVCVCLGGGGGCTTADRDAGSAKYTSGGLKPCTRGAGKKQGPSGRGSHGATVGSATCFPVVGPRRSWTGRTDHAKGCRGLLRAAEGPDSARKRARPATPQGPLNSRRW